MATMVKYNGVQYESIWAFLLLSYDERRRVLGLLDRGSIIAKVTLPKDPRAQAVACEAYLAGASPVEMAQLVMARAQAGWPETLDVDRIVVRLIYERMYEAETTRQVAGFSKPHFEVLERELAAGALPFEIACALWRLQRRFAQSKWHDSALLNRMPHLHLEQKRLPVGVKVSSMVSPLRRYEPVFIIDNRAYPVSCAWVMLPQRDIREYVNEVGGWMAQEWPDALEACDTPIDRVAGYSLDRRNTTLAAEAFARGYLVEEAAQFIFEQRIREDEAVA